MHNSSYCAMQYLLEHLCVGQFDGRSIRVLDVGSQVAETGQNSYRSLVGAIDLATYIGLDVVAGNNVDVVALNAYEFPFEAESFEIAISGQAFEHIEHPWLTMSEIARVLKPNGLAFVIAPSSGPEHRYPKDCWRFYPDGMHALAKWAKLECIAATTNWNETRRFGWGDTIGVFAKVPAGNWAAVPYLDIDDMRRTVYRPLEPSRFSLVRRSLGDIINIVFRKRVVDSQAVSVTAHDNASRREEAPHEVHN